MTIKQQGGIFGRNPNFNDVTVDGGLSFGDNIKAQFGTGNDLQVYHNGSHSYIDNVGAGNLNLKAANAYILSSEGEVMLGAIGNNTVYIAYDNQTKFQTTSTGISVTGNITVPSGNGIDFSATSGTGTSELFDDYEEGTWTPVIIGRSSAGTGTYTTQRGMYTKVGDTVFFYAILNWSAHTGTGNMAISGLPFTTFGTIGHNPTMAVMGNNLTFSGQLSAIIDRNATTITIRTFASGGAASDLAMDTAAGIYVSGFYKAA